MTEEEVIRKCLNCVYMKKWYCFKHKKEMPKLFNVCDNFISINDMTIEKILEIRKEDNND